MSSGRTPRARDDRTLEYFELSTPVPMPASIAAQGGPDEAEDAMRRTSTGLGTDGHLTSGVYDVDVRARRESRAEERWLALWEQGLIDLGAIPVLLGPPEDALSGAEDALQAHVVARIESGTTMRALLETTPFSAPEVMRMVGRLIDRKLVRLM